MKIIRRIDELEGSCYIEVLPGKYVGECWNNNSIYFNEEEFAYLETAIEIEYPKYDHYAFNDIDKDSWLRILRRFDEIIKLLVSKPKIEYLKEHIGFLFSSSEEEFVKDYDHNIEKLIDIIKEFQTWIIEQVETEDYVSVLGI